MLCVQKHNMFKMLINEVVIKMLTKHDIISGVSMYIFLFEVWWEKFDVASTTVNALLMFYSELDHERLILVAEISKAGWHRVEMSILTGLKTCKFTVRYLSNF